MKVAHNTWFLWLHEGNITCFYCAESIPKNQPNTSHLASPMVSLMLLSIGSTLKKMCMLEIVQLNYRAAWCSFSVKWCHLRSKISSFSCSVSFCCRYRCNIYELRCWKQITRLDTISWYKHIYIIVYSLASCIAVVVGVLRTHHLTENLDVLVFWQKYIQTFTGKASFAPLLCSDTLQYMIQSSWLEWTPLHYACHYGCSEMAALLISTGAEVDARSHVSVGKSDVRA